jgi:hypothetical protein
MSPVRVAVVLTATLPLASSTNLSYSRVPLFFGKAIVVGVKFWICLVADRTMHGNPFFRFNPFPACVFAKSISGHPKKANAFI